MHPRLLFISLLFITLFCSFNVRAQYVDWTTTLGGLGDDSFTDGVVLADGSTVAVGAFHSATLPGYPLPPTGVTAWFVKMTQTGAISTVRYFTSAQGLTDVESIVATTDGGFLVAGQAPGATSITLLKLSATGQSIWRKTFMGAYGSMPIDLAILSTGEAMLAYSVRSSPNSTTDFDTDIKLLLLAADGTTQWEQTYGLPAWAEHVQDMSITSDNGVVLVGQAVAADGIATRPWLFRVDNQGHKLWERFFGDGVNETFTSVAVGNGNTVWVAGSGTSPTDATVPVWYYARVKANGQLDWHRSYQQPANPTAASSASYLQSVMATPNGGALLAADNYVLTPQGTPIQSMMLAQADSAGNLLWERAHSQLRFEHCQKLLPGPDGLARLLGSVAQTGGVNDGRVITLPTYTVTVTAASVACTGETISVTIATDSQPNSTTYIAELSAGDGSFTNPAILAIGISAGSGVLQIPTYVGTGAGFRIRLTSEQFAETRPTTALFRVLPRPVLSHLVISPEYGEAGQPISITGLVEGLVAGYPYSATATNGVDIQLTKPSAASALQLVVNATQSGSFTISVQTLFRCVAVQKTPDFNVFSTTYVTPNGAGQQTGRSWADALPGSLLTQTLSQAKPGARVWVSGGLYKPTATLDRTVSFSVAPGVSIYGGFVGTETSLTQRPTASPSSTTLSGDIGAVNTVTDNTYHVVRLNANPTQTQLNNLVITGGNATSFDEVNSNAGGGILLTNSNATIVNCLITTNRGYFGAGVRISSSVDATSMPTFIDCTLQNNVAPDGGLGGGMYSSGPGSKVSLVNCLITGNLGHYKGGGFFLSECTTTMLNCRVTNNQAQSGGALASDVTSSPCRSTFINCLLTGNSASNAGGVLTNDGYGGAAGIACITSFINCTLFGNRSYFGSISSSSGNRSDGNQIFMKNSIVWGHTTPLWTNLSITQLFIDYSDVQGGQPGTGNVDVDPLFIDLANNDFSLQRTSSLINSGDPLSTTQSASATDLAGSARIAGGRIDMGPYESLYNLVQSVQHGSWANPTTWACQCIPQTTDQVLIRHTVQLPVQQAVPIQQIRFSGVGQLIGSQGAGVRFSQ